MKKNNLLIVALFCFGIGTIKAQYTVLLNFNGTNGNSPYGSLTLSASGNVLYGMTNHGGVNGDGNVFSIHTDGTGYEDILDFNETNGWEPDGSLVLSGTKLFGMTEFGGANVKGNIFSIDTNGTGYKDLLDFNTTNGATPLGSLIISGNILYGMTDGGGATGEGLVFSIDSDGTMYKDLLDFNVTNGLQPYGALTLSTSGSVLYGETYSGGAYSDGLVFSMDTNGTGYKDLLDFNYTNGQDPSWTSLTLSGKVLYGMAHLGGSAGYGTLFAIDTDGTGYRNLINFGLGNGKYPEGSLTLSGGVLYGMTEEGGGTSFGTIFSIDTDGTGYSNLYDFNDTVGAYPWGSLTLNIPGNLVYGMTESAGTFGDGVVFSFAIPVVTGLKSIQNVESIKVYPNPNNGYFNISGLIKGQIVEIYNYTGQKQSNTVADNTTMNFDISSFSNGVYLIRIQSRDGSIVKQQKMVKSQ